MERAAPTGLAAAADGKRSPSARGSPIAATAARTSGATSSAFGSRGRSLDPPHRPGACVTADRRENRVALRRLLSREAPTLGFLLALPPLFLFGCPPTDDDDSAVGTDDDSADDDDRTGSWSGDLTQHGFGAYAVEFTIPAMVPGAAAGTSNYSRSHVVETSPAEAFPCGGDLTCGSMKAGVHALDEVTSSGSGCVDGSYTQEMVDGDSAR